MWIESLNHNIHWFKRLQFYILVVLINSFQENPLHPRHWARWCVAWKYLHQLSWSVARSLYNHRQRHQQLMNMWNNKTCAFHCWGPPSSLLEEGAPPAGLTWVIKWDQDVLWGLLLGATFEIDDGEWDPLYLGNVIRHAACGVNHETKHGWLWHSH